MRKPASCIMLISRKEFAGYPFSNPQFPHPSEHPFGSPQQYPHPAPVAADTHYRNASPPLENPLHAILKKEPGLPPNASSRTGTPNPERDARPALLPSPMIRSSSHASFISQTDLTPMDLGDGARDGDNVESLPDPVSKTGMDSASV
jgi:hypothetical protein